MTTACNEKYGVYFNNFYSLEIGEVVFRFQLSLLKITVLLINIRISLTDF